LIGVPVAFADPEPDGAVAWLGVEVEEPVAAGLLLEPHALTVATSTKAAAADKNERTER
jgi:hypothetical protein